MVRDLRRVGRRGDSRWVPGGSPAVTRVEESNQLARPISRSP